MYIMSFDICEERERRMECGEETCGILIPGVGKCMGLGYGRSNVGQGRPLTLLSGQVWEKKAAGEFDGCTTRRGRRTQSKEES